MIPYTNITKELTLNFLMGLQFLQALSDSLLKVKFVSLVFIKRCSRNIHIRYGSNICFAVTKLFIMFISKNRTNLKSL